MIAAPDLEEVALLLQDQEGETEAGGEATVIHLADVEMETANFIYGATRRLTVCWELADLFIRAQSVRSSQAFELLKFSVDDQACRPRRNSLLAAAESWISQAMDEDAAGDYATAEDGGEADALP